MTASPVLLEPTIATSGFGLVSAAGDTLVIREWTDSGPSYLHIHHCDDEAWYVLEGCLRFRFEHGEVDGFCRNSGTGTGKQQVDRKTLMRQAGGTARRATIAACRHISPAVCASYGSTRRHPRSRGYCQRT